MTEPRLNSKLTEIVRQSGVNVTIYDINCPICDKETTMMVYKDETLEEKLEMTLRELIEYHDNK